MKKQVRTSFLTAIIVGIIGLSFLAAGCGSDIFSKGLAGDSPGNQSEQPGETPSPSPPIEQPSEPAKDPESPGEKPNPPANTPDYSTEVSNKKLSWYFIANSEHQTPGIPDSAKFITKYGGMYVGDPSGQTIYLTFDCGYENGYTPPILDALKANGVKAAFFVTKSYIDRNPELVRRMVAEGHQVCSHTATHPSLPDVSDARIENELTSTADAFRDVTGQEMSRHMRPPSGEYSQRTVRLTQQYGYATVFWSMAYRDWEVDNQQGAEFAYNYVMKYIHPGAVILLHAVSSSNAEAMDRILKGLQEQGYQFSLLP
ncbi:MAG: polysaccharide deacetylase family protein [Syntrophomonadaceae bacterium]|nr:polysaccharide deacetylase family protein [Syntrophomonadaceae bacterium]